MKIWFTLTGTNHYLGSDFLDGVGHIGYVANSPWTVLGESYSAGRLYDKIGDTAKGKIRLVTDRGVLCTLKQKKDPDPPEGTDEAPGSQPESEPPVPQEP